ncbi:MAG: asparagine synthase (glutamine-hydrolyzing) [Rhodocyclales bacterium]|nr:asparagine synthase (glutamine-hydrolyzing) [Rhodocyclales bacterium]
MCGILGWLSPTAVGERQRFTAALNTLMHRGPDDMGVYEADGVLLGHRRLSIIDLSSAGRQPMVDAASGNVITFNGEIYNYIEIRAELERHGHQFRTASDTEVLLHAFRQWGRNALSRLNGMWAFAIWQPAARTLFIARDRFGVKPFHYALTGSGFIFASEPKAILELAPEMRRPDDVAVFNFLSEGLLHAGTRTFYEGIRTLPAGCCAELQLNGRAPEISRYWSYPAPAATVPPADEAVREFSRLLDDAVRLRTRSDVKVGLTLSGGLDSTAVLASVQRNAPGDVVCFTSVYGGPEQGEASWAALAARPYGLVPVEVEAAKRDWFETLSEITWHMDGPGYSPAVYPLWHLMKEARRRGVYVLLEGQGADEALGGYPQYAVVALIEKLKRVRTIADVASVLGAFANSAGTFTATAVLKWLLRETIPSLVALNRNSAGAASTLAPAFRSAVRGATPDEDLTPPPGGGGYDAVTARLHRDHARDILPALLQYGDAISMAHGVESRLPFMDFRLVEWLFSHGSALKIDAGRTKWLLRSYLMQAGQAGISARKDKLGYPTPVEKWLAEDQGRLVRDLLVTTDARIRRYCDLQQVARLVDRHLSGRKGSGNHLYRLVSMELWMRRCLG